MPDMQECNSIITVKEVRVCGMCIHYSNDWCNACGQIVVAPIATDQPTTTGIPRRKTDVSCGQFAPHSKIDSWSMISKGDGKKNQEKYHGA